MEMCTTTPAPTDVCAECGWREWIGKERRQMPGCAAVNNSPIPDPPSWPRASATTLHHQSFGFERRKGDALQCGLFGQLRRVRFDAGRFLPAVAHTGTVPGNVAAGNFLLNIRFGGMTAVVAIEIVVDEVVVGVGFDVELDFFLGRDFRGEITDHLDALGIVAEDLVLRDLGVIGGHDEHAEAGGQE